MGSGDRRFAPRKSLVFGASVGRGSVRGMEENPYSRHLEGREAVAVLGASAGRLRELFGSFSAEEIDASPGPGRWSLRELMAHLADCEIAWGWRLRQALSKDMPMLDSFDQDRWADRYQAYDFASAQVTFEVLRAWNLRLLTGVSEQDRLRSAEHPERGRVTLGTIVETMAGHDLHHIKLIEGLRKKEANVAVPSPS